MEILNIVLDVLLISDCAVAVIYGFLLVRGIKRGLQKCPPYKDAAASGSLSYTLGKRLYNSLYGTFSYKRGTVTQEVEYEAYRQDMFIKSLVRLVAVCFATAVIADLCCFFDGLAAEGYALGVYTALCGFIAGTLAGVLAGLYLSRAAYKSGLVETVSRSDWFVKEDGTLRRSSRNCYFAAYLVCIPSGWCLAATVSFTVYTIILMFIV